MKNIVNALRQIWGSLLYFKYKHLYEKDPRLAADALYRKIYNRGMDIDNPKNLIEKITWLQFNSDTSLWTLCADKYRMRSYVESKGFGHCLPSLLGHWDNPRDIDFEALPDKFVLKANNGCGTVMIIEDKSKIRIDKVEKTIGKWLKRPFGYWGAQKHYLAIKPCVIAEELLRQDSFEKEFSPNSMADYKVWCFNGKPECILVVYNRTPGHYYLDLYDLDWHKMSEKLRMNGHFGYRENIIPRPVCLDEMLEIAASLSAPFKEVRVDFYVVNNSPIIGELTFTTGYGYFTDDYYEYLGGKIQLNI